MNNYLSQLAERNTAGNASLMPAALPPQKMVPDPFEAQSNLPGPPNESPGQVFRQQAVTPSPTQPAAFNASSKTPVKDIAQPVSYIEKYTTRIEAATRQIPVQAPPGEDSAESVSTMSAEKNTLTEQPAAKMFPGKNEYNIKQLPEQKKPLNPAPYLQPAPAAPLKQQPAGRKKQPAANAITIGKITVEIIQPEKAPATRTIQKTAPKTMATPAAKTSNLIFGLGQL